MYATEHCSYCMAARMLLKKKNLDYEEILISTDAGRREEMERITGRQTVPQILIGEDAIGGFDEIYALEQNGELDRMLAQADSVPAN